MKSSTLFSAGDNSVSFNREFQRILENYFHKCVFSQHAKVKAGIMKTYGKWTRNNLQMLWRVCLIQYLFRTVLVLTASQQFSSKYNIVLIFVGLEITIWLNDWGIEDSVFQTNSIGMLGKRSLSFRGMRLFKGITFIPGPIDKIRPHRQFSI